MDDHRSAQSAAGDLDVPGFTVTPRRHKVGAVLPVVRAEGRRLADGLHVSLTYVPIQAKSENVKAGGDAMAFAGELSRLRHDHLIRIHDVVPLAGEGTKPPRLVLATAVTGAGSLTELLTRRSPLSVAETVTVVVPVAEAMTHLHQNGVVHGALTTDAVLFTDRGMPLLADAAIDRLSCVRITPMAVSGTSAPEISEGYAATTESDAYAFAVVIWTALVGSGPGWVGDRADLAELAPHVPARIVSVVTSALSPEPGERPDISEIARTFSACAHAEPIDLAELDAVDDVPRRIRALAGRPPTIQRAPRRRGVVPLVVVAVAVLAVALAAVTLLFPGPLNLIEQDALASAQPAHSTPQESTATTTEASPPATLSTALQDDSASPSREVKPSTRTLDATTPDESRQEEVTAKATIQTLVDTRAAAWESADPRLLAEVHSPGSIAMTTDRDDLDAAITQGSRLVDLDFVVNTVDVVERVPQGATSWAETDELTARISVRREPLTMVSPQGTHQDVAARTDVVDVTLRRESQGWRFVSWT